MTSIKRYIAALLIALHVPMLWAAPPTTMTDLSATIASNSPAGTDVIGTTLDDYLRAGFGILRRLAANSTIASAGTMDIGAVEAEYLSVSGTTTITGLGTIAAGIRRVLVFEGALTFTHNATSLILPGGANITTAAGDVAIMRSLGSGNWRCEVYSKASGVPVVTLPVANGGTGSTSAANARTALGLAIGTDVQAYDAELAAIAGLTFSQGGLIYGTGAAAAAVLPKGTASQQLRMNAGATAPEWFTPSATSSALVYLDTKTASASASLNFTSSINSTYGSYIIKCQDLIPSTDNVQLLLRTTTDATNFDSGAGHYQWVAFPANASGSGRTGSTGDTSINLLGTDGTYYAGSGTGEALHGVIRLSNPAGTAVYKSIEWNLHGPGQSSASPMHIRGSGFRASVADVDGVQLFFSSGNIASGICRLYGEANS